MSFERVQELRYGENPHQKARVYRSLDGMYAKNFEQLHGKDLSYNNLLDYEAARGLIEALSTSESALPTALIVKHLNPCGVASGTTLAHAIEKSKRCDPRSHFGGVIAVNTCLTVETAQDIAEDFAEIVIAPEYEPEALEILKKSKNLRILKTKKSASHAYEIKGLQTGILVQEKDTRITPVSELATVTIQKPTAAQLQDLELAWTVCAHVKSNAITLVKDGILIGVGAGQMSRIDSAELAVSKAQYHGHELQGAVAASDAFFPFPDTVELLAKTGIKAVVAPKGAKRDSEVVEAANTLGITLLFADERHFKH